MSSCMDLYDVGQLVIYLESASVSSPGQRRPNLLLKNSDLKSATC